VAVYHDDYTRTAAAAAIQCNLTVSCHVYYYSANLIQACLLIDPLSLACKASLCIGFCHTGPMSLCVCVCVVGVDDSSLSTCARVCVCVCRTCVLLHAINMTTGEPLSCDQLITYVSHVYTVHV